MKNFTNYINAISEKPILQKKAKLTTTIMLPELDTTEGIYRSLLPAYVINGTQPDLRMLIIGMAAKLNVSNNEKNFHITKELIAETDHFVFPFVSYALRPIIEKIKQHKSGVKFSYYVDNNFYQMPNAYPFAKEYNVAKMWNVIEDNFKAVDQVICTNSALIDYIAGRINEKYPQKIGTDFQLQRIYILPELFKTSYTNTFEKDKVRVLVIGDEYHFSDINFIRGTLKDFKCKYKDKADIHIIGFDGMRNEKNYLKDLQFTHHPRVPYFKYFELIKHISPSVLVIPATDSPFNKTSKNYAKYLEFAYMNISVIGPNITPYSNLITTNQNGFLCDDKNAYLFQMETMFVEPAKYEGSLGLAYATAVEHIITDPANIAKLIRIYFPGYESK